MQGKIGLRTVGRDNRDATIHDVHQDATSSPFRRPTDAVKKPIVESDTKRKAVEELKPSSTKKTTQPTRRSTRLSKTQPTLYDVFSRTRTNNRSEKEHEKKRERDDHESNEPSKKQRTLSNDDTSNNAASELPATVTQESAPVSVKEDSAPATVTEDSAPVSVVEDSAPATVTEDSAAVSVAEDLASSSTIKDDNVIKNEHQQNKSSTVDLPASPAESPEHHPSIRDTPSPLRDLPPTPSSLGSTSRQKDIATTHLPKPISSSKPIDKVQTGDGNYITTHLNPKTRMAEESETLEKLRSALDVSLTFHAGHQRVALFHNIQPMLRNSTKKNITVSHIAKILYLAPVLYKMTPKVLNQGRQTLETYQVDFGDDWTPPLTGKDLEQRKELLSQNIKKHFDTHGEGPIPEKELPKHDKIVDQKKWIETAKLPSGVRDLLKFEEQRKEDEKRKEQIKKEQKAAPIAQGGSVKDRRQALLERIRAKSAKK